MDYNKALFETYKKHWTNLQIALKKVDTVQLRISYPLLIHIFPEYQETKVKLFVVGQQTGGWGWDNAKYWGTSSWDDSIEKLDDLNFIKKLIEELIEVYRRFHTEKYSRGVLLPTARKLFRKLNPSSPEQGFVWSNLIKIDQACRPPEDHIEEMACNSFPVLPHEIKITDPDVVIFFTGPRYDPRLRQTFKGLSFDKIEGHSEKTLSRLVHSGLPRNSFKTYHPNYFKRSGKLDELAKVMNKIAKLAEV